MSQSTIQSTEDRIDGGDVTEDGVMDRIVCQPTKWFIWRVAAMLLMFSVFAFLFLQDGLYGYRDKNLHYFLKKTFDQAGADFQEQNVEGGLSESAWEAFARSQVCLFPGDGEAILPKGTDLKMAWPDELAEGYSLMKEKGGQNGASQLWEVYTSARGWDVKPADHPMESHKITEQFVAAGVAVVLILGTLFIGIRTMRRTIEADGEYLYTQDGCRVAYSDMVRVDKRKWDTKGLALIYYEVQGEERKAKIDGMVYGQFKEEDGAPAEKLFSRVMEHFKGEVLEYADPDDDDGALSEADSESDGDSKAENAALS